MWSLILSVVLNVAPVADSPVIWTIASDGSMVALCLMAPAETVEPEIEHTAKPTIKPVVLTHTWNQHGCLCPEMCVGQHLRNAHGKTYDGLDDVGYRNWSRYHKRLHDEGVYRKPKFGCVGGTCPAPQRRRLFGRLRGG